MWWTALFGRTIRHRSVSKYNLGVERAVGRNQVEDVFSSYIWTCNGRVAVDVCWYICIIGRMSRHSANNRT